MPPSMTFNLPKASPRRTVIQPSPRLPGTPRANELAKLRAENETQRKMIEDQKRMIQQIRTSAALGSSSTGTGNAVTQLRQRLVEAQRTVQYTQASLQDMLEGFTATSRAGYLRTLPELIGPPPLRTWQEEWIHLKAESYRLCGQGEEAGPEADVAYVREFDNYEKFVKQEWVKSDIEMLVQQDWSYEKAECYTLLYTCVDALARALNDKDDCYAASTYALSEALFAMRHGAKSKDATASTSKMRISKSQRLDGLSPDLYMNRTGNYGLVTRDPAWENLEVPDGTGFRGLTSAALTHAMCDPRYFQEEGFVVKSADLEGNPILEVCLKSDIICFESHLDDDTGAHGAIMINQEGGDFPPNTLFRFQRVEEPGTWAAPAFPGEPPVYPKQRLIVVTATYQPPRAGVAQADNAGSKMCGNPVTLSYASREIFLKGLDDLIAKPNLTMENEFERDMEWSDWKGVPYTLRTEWKYVTGVAKTKTGCTPGTRDQNNDGKTPADFLKAANKYIQERRAQGHGTKAWIEHSTLLAEDHAFLTLDEVQAVRLYSGPAFQPINTFLRQIAPLTDEFRTQVAQHPGLTFSATVGHICRAIRKLTAVTTPEEAVAPLFRGVRGQLERAFYMPDSQGMVCAVDMAFMSTSKHRTAPIEYMQTEGGNVLWALQPKPESDSGFHRGANIEMLSQFAGEEEVLFPPCTMLIVKEKDGRPSLSTADDNSRTSADLKKMALHSQPSQLFKAEFSKYSVSEKEEGDKHFTQIDVLPVFL